MTAKIHKERMSQSVLRWVGVGRDKWMRKRFKQIKEIDSENSMERITDQNTSSLPIVDGVAKKS